MITSNKIFKLSDPMVSKSCNWYINRKLTTREFQRDQNRQIPIYILRVIDPASQRPTSDWKWTMVSQTLNWGVKWSWKFILYPRKSDEIKNSMNLESSDSEFRSKRYHIFKISKNLSQIWVKMKNKMTLNTKLTS